MSETGKREWGADFLLEPVCYDRSWGDVQPRRQLISFFDAWGPFDPTAASFHQK